MEAIVRVVQRATVVAQTRVMLSVLLGADALAVAVLDAIVAVQEVKKTVVLGLVPVVAVLIHHVLVAVTAQAVVQVLAMDVRICARMLVQEVVHQTAVAAQDAVPSVNLRADMVVTLAVRLQLGG